MRDAGAFLGCRNGFTHPTQASGFIKSTSLEKLRQVQTRFGLVAVYAEMFDGHRSLVSFLSLKGNPMLISGGMLPDSTVNGGWARCRAVSVETYTQVLKSLAVVK